ncbi:MAG: hypothetical protein ACRD19_03565, partial [Terriglobia bacterium]
YEEFERLYGAPANRVDGHHHMHLCANVVFGKLLPFGAIVRRNFTFAPGEKSFLNRVYRSWQDGRLARRHRLADFLFNLAPLYPRPRLERIFALGAGANVEVETHPVNDEEYKFLSERQFGSYAGEGAVARGYVLRRFNSGGNAQGRQQAGRPGSSAVSSAEKSIL